MITGLLRSDYDAAIFHSPLVNPAKNKLIKSCCSIPYLKTNRTGRRNIDESQSLLDDIYTEMRWIFREISNHCDEESFLAEMDRCEDDFYYYRRTVENELEEKRNN